MLSQMETAECGLACLAYASSKIGAHLDLAELRQRFPVSARGLSLKDIAEVAAGLDMLGRAVQCDLDELSQLKLPAILHWDLNHFVVLDKVGKGTITIHDPARGRLKLRAADAGKSFTGIALELSASPTFRKRREKSPLSILQWVRLTPDLYNGLGQAIIMSLLLQAYIVASPFYIELAVDQGALKGDAELLKSLAIGFGCFALFNAIASMLRNFATQQLSAFLSWDMSLRLFRHLVRLPLPWFQKRRLADTLSRFDAINTVRDLVSGALISAMIDGLLAVATVIMMFVFSWQLAICGVVGVMAYAIIRLACLPTSLRLSGENLSAQIAENGKRIETIKAIQTIKIMSAEVEQEVQWSNRYAAFLKKTLHKTRFDITSRSANQAIDGIVSTLIIFLGAKAIIDRSMTVGILYAFMSYRGQFSSALTNVIDQMIQWRLSDVYSFRLADIVLTAKEDGIDKVEIALPEVRGEIEVENVTFRYSPFEPFVIKNLNLFVKEGEFIAIVGPSGAGKTTLLKLICGLYPPSSGEIRIDGRSLAAWGPKALRRSIGVVMQDDELLSGTIAENVAFFDEKIDMTRVWEALDAASVKDEIMAMPMKAESLIGDMGSALSGGQKQRILIARALYKRPKILFFDEATSHLDNRNETIINASLKRLNITRIVIAHRTETIQAADRIFDVRSGQFLSVVKSQHQ